MRRRVALAAAAMAVIGASSLPGASASGDTTVTVRGTDLPALARSHLNVVGCTSLFGRTGQGVAPMIGAVHDARRPADKRSLAFDLGLGDAVGPVSYVDHVAATTVAGMEVYAEAGATGVAYVGYQPPSDARTTRMWIGRADLSVPADQWTTVDATGRSLTWTQYDMTTRQPTGSAGGVATLPAFVAGHGGDGYGFYAFGFGCDGQPFNMDDWRIGAAGAVTTYDFDGYQAQLSGGHDVTVAPGGLATLTADVTGAVPGAQVVLESKQDGEWAPVAAKPGPHVSVDVHPAETTQYRWKIYSTSMVEGDQTSPFTVTVTDDPPAEPPAPPTSPTSAPAGQAKHATTKPAATPTKKTTPTSTPTPTPSTAPASPSTPAGPAASTGPAEPTGPTGPAEPSGSPASD